MDRTEEVGTLLRNEFLGEADQLGGLHHFDHLLASAQQDFDSSKPPGGGISVRRLGIVGAGLMGAAVAAAALRRGLGVVLYDNDEAALPAARQRTLMQLRGDISGPYIQHAADNLFTLIHQPDFSGCDVVVESIVENLPAKKQVYEQVEAGLCPGALLASNTSTIPIAQLAAGLRSPDRFCGLHFFHPVRQRPLVEIVRGPATSASTIAAAAALAKRIGKLPIVVADGPGFLVNRLLLPYLGEALDLLREGVDMSSVETAATRFGMSLGPLRLLDEIGLDTALRAGMVLFSAFPDRTAASPLLVAMVKRGRLGRKTGVGFFRYAGPGDERCLGPDPEALALIREWLRPAAPSSQEAITTRLFYPMLLEATRVLEEGRVESPRDVDLAAILGLGFPAARGGPLYWADTLRPRNVLSRLWGLRSLGARAEPTALLLEMARTGRRFYRRPIRGPVPGLVRRSEPAVARVAALRKPA
jgi:3-hydroxyacyl-CoA dehydrogenase